MNPAADDEERVLSKGEQIDLGLAVLSVRARRGVGLSSRQIAAWCGCSWQAIWLIEQAALRKVGDKLRALGVCVEDVALGAKEVGGEARMNGCERKRRGRLEG